MRRSLKGLTFTAIGAAVLAYATSASALTITVTDVKGTWTDTSPVAGISGLGSSTISWGNPIGGGGKSSYTFDGVTPPPQGPFNVGEVFSIGEFIHNNQPITGTTLQTAELTLDWKITINNGSSLDVEGTSVYDFSHNETPNNAGSCPPGSVSICDDIVTFDLNDEETDVFTFNGEQYIFTISSFLVGGSPVTDFLTQEGKENEAFLQGSVNVVPVPAAVWLLGSAVAGLGVAGWRKRQAA